MLPHLDAIYFDLKLFDGELHRRYCGLPNAIILTNFIRLGHFPAGTASLCPAFRWFPA